MKYSELIRFESIESVVELRVANAQDDARRLVATYVISERMAEQLTRLVFRQLQFDKPADNKGLLIVGNYGTGKSHLMAVISSLAEHAELAAVATSPLVSDEARSIAGRFKVIREEINTEMSLGEFVFGVLDEHLAMWGVRFSFPPLSEIRNPKDAFADMMEAFAQAYPSSGILFVLDELLEHLDSRHRGGSVLVDLKFLRALGEVCKTTRFRFVSGVQESLFDNPRFQLSIAARNRTYPLFCAVRHDVVGVSVPPGTSLAG